MKLATLRKLIENYGSTITFLELKEILEIENLGDYKESIKNYK